RHRGSRPRSRGWAPHLLRTRRSRCSTVAACWWQGRRSRSARPTHCRAIGSGRSTRTAVAPACPGTTTPPWHLQGTTTACRDDGRSRGVPACGLVLARPTAATLARDHTTVDEDFPTPDAPGLGPLDRTLEAGRLE